MTLNSAHIFDFAKIGNADEELIGKKAYETGQLFKLGIPFPDGFVITTKFFNDFINLSGIQKEIDRMQKITHPAISDSTEALLYSFQTQIVQLPIPQELTASLNKFYRKYSGLLGNQSFDISSTFSDGKFMQYSDVSGDANFILIVKTIWSLSPMNPIAILVQKHIKSKFYGKIMTNNPRFNAKLTEEQQDELSSYCKIIQKFYYFPKEIDYVIKNGKVFIIKINQFTGAISGFKKQLITPKTKTILAKGTPVNPGIATGPIRNISNPKDYLKIIPGDVIFLTGFKFPLSNNLKRAKALIAAGVLKNLSDKAKYRKTLHIPTIEGIKNSAKIFKNGDVVTVNGITGEIYSGGLIY